MDSFDKKLICSGIAFVLVLVGAVSAVVINEDDWRDKCKDAGGTITEEFTGYITTFVQVGKVLVPQQTPTYDLHCMVDGKEITI